MGLELQPKLMILAATLIAGIGALMIKDVISEEEALGYLYPIGITVIAIILLSKHGNSKYKEKLKEIEAN